MTEVPVSTNEIEPCNVCGLGPCECTEAPTARWHRWRQGYAVGYWDDREDDDPMLRAWPNVEWAREHEIGWEVGRAAYKRDRQHEREVRRELGLPEPEGAG